MTLLRFPTVPRRVPGVTRTLASLEALLAECRDRRESLRLERARLLASLGRLRLLSRRMVRGHDRLRRSLGRLRACHRSLGAPPPGV